MKRYSLSYVLIILFTLVHSLHATVKADSVLLVPKAANPPVIDGKLDGIWHSVTNTFMEIDLAGKNDIPASPDNWFDLWGSFRLMWDDDNIYIFVHRFDDVIVTGDNLSPKEYDGIEIYFDGDNSKTIGDYDGIDDIQIRFNYNARSYEDLSYGEHGQWAFNASGIKFVRLNHNYGWNLEISIPLGDLKIDAVSGKPFGFNIQLNDNDSGNLDHKWAWWSSDDESWHDASRFGTVEFSNYVADSVMQVLPAPSAPVIDGEMDDVWEEVPEISHNTYVTHGNSAPVVPFDMRIMLDNWYDCSFKFRTMWDNDNIYFWVVSYDGTLSVPFKEGDIPGNDGFEFFFDGDNSKRTYEQTYDDNDMQIRFEWGDVTISDLGGRNNPYNLSGIHYVQNETETGWVLELAFPFSMMDIHHPTEGDVLGFELHYNENDAGIRDAVARWWSDDNSSFENASLFGTMKLVDAPDDNTPVSHPIPYQTELKTNYPNPFNPTTNIQYCLSRAADVHLRIYDVLGHCVYVLNKYQEPGSYQIQWDGSDQSGNNLTSGIYFYRLEAGAFSGVMKMVLVR